MVLIHREISKEAWSSVEADVSSGEIFSKRDMDITAAAASAMAELSHGIPFYLQWIGYESYMLAWHERKRRIDIDTVQAVIEARLRFILPLEYDLARFTSRQQQILLAMARKNLTHPSRIAKAIRSPYTQHVVRELRTLEAQGYIIRKDRVEYHNYGNIFRRWLSAKAEESSV